MQSKLPYVVIGALIGVVVMQWAMPAAESQSTTLQAETFALVDGSGKIHAMMFVTNEGVPLLALGDPEGSSVLITAGEYAEVNCKIENGAEAQLAAGESYSSLRVEGRSSHIMVRGEELAGLEVGLEAGFPNESVSLSADNRHPDVGGAVITFHGGDVTDWMPRNGTAAKAVTWGQVKRDQGSPSASPKAVAHREVTGADRYRDEYRRRCQALRR